MEIKDNKNNFLPPKLEISNEHFLQEKGNFIVTDNFIKGDTITKRLTKTIQKTNKLIKNITTLQRSKTI